jgi:small subunit ribosomal protein S1
VIEFNRDDKRILVSHLRYLEDIKKEADESVKREKEDAEDQTRKAVKDTQSKVEKSTLGDMDVFADLKKEFDK